jgi:beta-glucosidase
LTVTFPKATADLPPFEDYSMNERTYRYTTREPLFPFGFGLSYIRYEYHDLKIVSSGRPTSGFRVAVTLKNAGAVTGDEVVQLYLSALETHLPTPQSQLIAFQRVSLKPGQVKAIHFNVKPEMLMFVDEDGRQKLEPGKYQLTAGGCSPGARGVALGAPQPVSVEFKI